MILYANFLIFIFHLAIKKVKKNYAIEDLLGKPHLQSVVGKTSLFLK